MKLITRNGVTVVHVVLIVAVVVVVGALAYGGLTKGKRRSNQPVAQ